MAGLITQIFLCVFLTLVLISVINEAKELHPRKLKKYDPAVESSKMAPMVKKFRLPRQTSNERRQYYPCISCFRVGSREICTSPFCPENYQCDRASKRCHKKANIRGRPETAPEEPEAPAEK